MIFRQFLLIALSSVTLTRASGLELDRGWAFIPIQAGSPCYAAASCRGAA